MKSSDILHVLSLFLHEEGERRKEPSLRDSGVLKKEIIEFDRNLSYGDEFHYRRNNYRRNNNIDNLEDRESAKGAKERIEKNMKKEGREVKVSTDGKWKKKKKKE